VLLCKSCNAALDLTMSTCPKCGVEVPLGRLTGMLGIVCRSCDAYNDPGLRTCVACGKPLGSAEQSSPGAAAGSEADALGMPRPPPAVRAAPPPVPVPAPAQAAPVPAQAPAAPTRAPAPPPAAPAARPAPSFTARLCVERGEAPHGSVFKIAGTEVQAGSAQGQIQFPRDPCLSPLHATFVVRDQSLIIRDEGAAGGVYVRLRGSTVSLRPGGLFAVGDRLLRYGGTLPPPPPTAPDGTHRQGSPRPEPAAVMVEEWLEGGIGGRSYVRVGPSITVGRTGCSINLGDDPFVSQAHAELVIESDGSAKLRDLGSSNGTFVRLPPGGEHQVIDGDRVRMGREVLRVEVG
jgi:hypothetical protein